MADLAAAGAPHHLYLAGGERREVVMQHERLGGFARYVDAVDPLLVVTGAQSNRDQRLGLAPGKEARAMGTWQHPGLNRDWTNGVEITAIHSLGLLQHLLPHDPVLDLLQLLGNVAP